MRKTLISHIIYTYNNAQKHKNTIITNNYLRHPSLLRKDKYSSNNESNFYESR